MDVFQIGAIAGGATAAVVVPVVMRLFAKAYPAESFVVPPDFDRLKTRFKRWELLSRFAFIPLSAALTYLIWLLLQGLAYLRTSLLPIAEYTLVIQAFAWLLPAIFLSILAAGIVIDFVTRRTFGSDYDLLTKFVDNKYRVNSNAVMRIIIPIVLIICTALVVMGLNLYVQIDRNGFVVSRLFSLEPRTYRYEDITRIRQSNGYFAPNGNFIEKRAFEVLLSDGSNLSSLDEISILALPDVLARDQELGLFELLSQRSGKSIDSVAPFRR